MRKTFLPSGFALYAAIVAASLAAAGGASACMPPPDLQPDQRVELPEPAPGPHPGT